MKPDISAHERLTATLRFLATGKNYEDLKFTTTLISQHNTDRNLSAGINFRHTLICIHQREFMLAR